MVHNTSQVSLISVEIVEIPIKNSKCKVEKFALVAKYLEQKTVIQDNTIIC